MYPGKSDARHFQEANKQLHKVFDTNSTFAQDMETLYPGIVNGVQPGPRGSYPRKSPVNTLTWHHEANRPGVLQLVPTAQHRAKGDI